MNIHIPPAALEAGARLLCRERHPCWSIVSEIMETDHDGQATEFRNLARAAFLAMVENWPGAQRVKGYFTHDTDYYEPAFILPLTEKTDDKA